MRVIRGLALGTYYAKGATAATDTPNSTPMRGLAYAVKNNRQTPNKPQPVAHSRHPASPRPVWVDRTNAIAYVAAIISRHLPRIRKQLGLDADDALLVPVPSSTVVVDTIETDRFPALKLALACEAIGLGECLVAAVNRSSITPKTAGRKRTADQLLANLELVTRLPGKRRVVLIDDLATSGASFAAVDRLLGMPPDIRALVVALTDSQPCADAYNPRSFAVTYDDTASNISSLQIIRRAIRNT